MAGQDKALAEGTVKLQSATCAVSCAMLCYRPHWLYSPIGGDSWHLAARKWQQATSKHGSSRRCAPAEPPPASAHFPGNYQ